MNPKTGSLKTSVKLIDFWSDGSIRLCTFPYKLAVFKYTEEPCCILERFNALTPLPPPHKNKEEQHNEAIST